jgi:hypothetical protein
MPVPKCTSSDAGVGPLGSAAHPAPLRVVMPRGSRIGHALLLPVLDGYVCSRPWRPHEADYEPRSCGVLLRSTAEVVSAVRSESGRQKAQPPWVPFLWAI